MISVDVFPRTAHTREYQAERVRGSDTAGFSGDKHTVWVRVIFAGFLMGAFLIVAPGDPHRLATR